jgi:beta-phosphoglucomutase
MVRTDADRAIALDLDGVLIDGMPYHIAAWTEAFARFRIKVDPAHLYRLEGISSREVVDRIVELDGLSLSRSQRDEVARFKRQRFRDLFEVVALPGAHELVATIRLLGYRLALVTGTTADAGERALDELGIRSAFSHVVSGDDVPRGKPAPDPYRRAQEMLDVPPSHCLAVENAPAGISAAVAAGLPCVAVATYLDASYLQEAGLVLARVPDVTSWLEEEAKAGGTNAPFALNI